jgi:hypothetical protein
MERDVRVRMMSIGRVTSQTALSDRCRNAHRAFTRKNRSIAHET